MHDAVLNLDTIQNLKTIMGEEFPELVSIYLRDSCARLETFQAALAAQDFESLGFAAHSLKGSSANIGAMHLAEIAKCLEQSAKSCNLTECQRYLSEIGPIYQEACAALQQFC